MSITLYSGTPGSYKSYHATTEILKWLSWNRNVIANFPIKSEKYFKKPKGNFIFVRNTDLTVDYLLEHHKKYHKPSLKAQTLVVIDEASIPFNSRQFDRKDRMDWVNFFANHRHYNYEFILIAQEDRMLDRQIRSLLEYDFKFRSLKNMNLAMMITSLLCGGLYHIVEYWYPCKMKVTTHLCRFNKKKASCYDTMGLFNFKDKKQDKNTSSKKMTISKTNIKFISKGEGVSKNVTDDKKQEA